MNFIKKAWLTFRQLKTWLQIVIVLLVISLLGAMGGSGSSPSNSGSNASLSNVPTSASSTKATPEVSASASTEPRPEATVSATPAKSTVEFKSALSKMRIVKDDVKNLKFYYDKTSPKYVNSNGFYLYTGQEAKYDPYLYLEIQYFGSDWLFIQSYFFNIDGETFEITPNYGDINTDNDSDVWEWYNQPANADNVEMIQKIVKSKKTVMRLEGRQYYKDVIISQAQKVALKNVLTVYEGLGGTF